MIHQPQVSAAHDVGCAERLVSLRQADKWLKTLDTGDPGYDRSEEYGFLLQQVQARLRSYGIQSRRLRKRLEDKSRTVVEITDILPLNVNGRIIARARERFALRVIVDPVMRKNGEGRGSTDAPDANVVYLDFHEVQRRFDRPNLVLLHEIRHVFLADRTARGGSHLFQGEMIAENDYRFERAGFYEDEISFEELSNYWRDLMVNRTRYARGEISRQHWLRDLRDMRRIARLVEAQLCLVREDTPEQFLFAESSEHFAGVVFVWPVFRGRFRDEDKIFYVHLDFPGVRRRIAARHLRAEAWTRINALLAEAKRLGDYAETQLTADTN